jgi:class 3 adenylate cyclase
MPADLRCPNCGFDNVAVAKYCANCGRPLGDAPEPSGSVLTAEARKVITVAFVDLVGSTALTERLDPEEARQVMGRFYDLVQVEVSRFEGTVANFLGDAVLVVFGLPASHEDDPERAICASLAIRDAVPRLNDALARDLDIRLQVRVGVNTGEVVAASGSTFDRDFLISDAVTTAARIQQTIAPGSVAVGERTYRLTRATIAFRDLPPLAVKGKTEPLRVWEAIARTGDRDDVTATDGPLVGRQRELALLHQLYERTCADSAPHLVTIVGQPGVGKSRLLREFLTGLRETSPDLLVLRGRSVAFGGQIGYPALLDILKAQAGLLDTDAPEAVRS